MNDNCQQKIRPRKPEFAEVRNFSLPFAIGAALAREISAFLRFLKQRFPGSLRSLYGFPSRPPAAPSCQTTSAAAPRQTDSGSSAVPSCRWCGRGSPTRGWQLWNPRIVVASIHPLEVVHTGVPRTGRASSKRTRTVLRARRAPAFDTEVEWRRNPRTSCLADQPSRIRKHGAGRGSHDPNHEPGFPLSDTRAAPHSEESWTERKISFARFPKSPGSDDAGEESPSHDGIGPPLHFRGRRYRPAWGRRCG